MHKIGNINLVVGKSYFEASYFEADAEDGTKEHITINEYVLRSIRKKYFTSLLGRRYLMGTYAHFTLKSKGATWVKLSNKHFHWGFANNVPDWCKKKYLVSDEAFFDFDLSPSKVGALRAEIARVRKYKALEGSVYFKRYETKEYKNQAIKKLTSQLNRERKKNVR